MQVGERLKGRYQTEVESAYAVYDEAAMRACGLISWSAFT
jgi:hypothetical protein